MARGASLCLIATTLMLLFLIARWRDAAAPRVDDRELAQLRQLNAQLQQKLSGYEARLSAQSALVEAAHKAARGADGASGSNGANATPPLSTVGSALASELLALHAHWDWKAIAAEMLQPFAYIDSDMLSNGVRACYQNGTMYCMRAQIRDNQLFITDYRAVFFDRHYAPSRVMPLLDVLRRHRIPDVDIVVAAVDEPRIKTLVDAREWSKTVTQYAGTLRCSDPFMPQPAGPRVSLPPPLFSSTVDRAHFDLAWPDFSFYMPRRPHKVRSARSEHAARATEPARVLTRSTCACACPAAWRLARSCVRRRGRSCTRRCSASPRRSSGRTRSSWRCTRATWARCTASGSRRRRSSRPTRSSSTSSSSATTARSRTRARSSGCTARAASSSTSAT